MTIEDRIVLELGDLLRVTLECKECGSAISSKPDALIVHNECPHCRAKWVTKGCILEQALVKLAQALAEFRTRKGEHAFSLRLEIAHPRA